ncbi:hypothetical protein [Sorangium sp. So ce1024]|uniref:hypothetical protein n=1 Tax=Sorangium sp. So ce1024 TaxID=3133327 RepID=UPI003F02AC46
MAMTAIERLESLLNNKDEEIEGLESKIEDLEWKLRVAEGGWTAHEKLEAEQSLPVPRLELVYVPLGERKGYEWSRYEVLYRLVYRHLLGHAMAVPFSRTEISGGSGDGPPIRKGKLDLPFRDGAHICNDMGQLKLPGFAVCGERVDDLSHLAGKPQER